MKLGTKIAIGLATTLLPAGTLLIAQSAFTMGGESYGTYIQTSAVSQPKTPVATLSWAGLASADAPVVNVPGVAVVSDITNMVTQAGDPTDANAQSTSSAESVNLLNGLIRADALNAIAAVMFKGTAASATAEGSEFANLTVNGVSISPNVAPNTVIALPGVGSVTLNEQIPWGDGVNSIGLTVNMIHVHLTGLTSGDIIVGSAESHLTR